MLAVGQRTGVVRVTPGQWQIEPVSGGAGGSLSAIWGSSADDIWVSSFISGVLGHYTQGRWQDVSTSAFAAALWGSAGDDIWGVSNKGFCHYDGSRWTSASLPVEGMTAITGCSATDLWAVGAAGAILHYDGIAWSPSESGTTNSLRAVRCSPGGVWVVGEGGIILRKLR